MLRLCTKDDFEFLLVGAAIYATGGGGGDIDEGMKLVKESILDRGVCVDVVDVEELDPESYIASAYMLGTIAPDARLRKSVVIENPILRAVEVYERVLGMKIDAFIPVELGAGNTAVAFYAAAYAKKPVVDGDRVGRAAPEIHQDTAILFNISPTPAVIVSPTGNEVVLIRVADVDDYEAIARHLAVLAGTCVTVVDTPMKISIAKNSIVRNSVSRCYELGKKVVELRRKGVDGDRIAEVVAEHMNGWVVFKGVVKEWRWRNEGGFLVGELIIEGVDEFRGRILRSWIKNEHIMVWLNNEPLVMPPDLFTLLTRDGEPLRNQRIEVGMKVIGIAAPAPQIWRGDRGLELFGPKHFGFNYEYIPVETLVKRHGLA